MLNKILPVFTIIVLATGCAVNPVTGEREFTFVSEAQELTIGEKNYIPSRQMQGGEYIVDKALSRYVQEIGGALAAVSDRKLPYDFVVLNNSVPNAWALPGGKIAVNRGLLIELGSEAELAAVLGHEIVHAAARHGAKGMERDMLLQGAILVTGIAARDNDYANLILGGSQLAASLVNQKYGRDAERESDYYGIRYMKRAGYDPQAAVSLQQTFVRLSEGRRQNWLQGLFASHPPSQERVDNNRAIVKEIGAGGTVGTTRYQAKIARLIKTKPAYEAYEKGRKSLADNDPKNALILVNKALSIEPREPHFHALKGDIQYTQGRFRNAKSNYDKAIAINPNFFHYLVQRGMTKSKLGDPGGAKKDLERSTKLLPTATALNTLGDIALKENNRQHAVQYYKAAAGSKSEPGQQAAMSLVRLELPQNPNQYLRLRTGLSNTGYLMVEINNPTPLAVNNIELLVQFRDGSGNPRQFMERVRGVVPAGKSAQLQTRLGPFSDRNQLRNVRTIINRAGLAE